MLPFKVVIMETPISLNIAEELNIVLCIPISSSWLVTGHDLIYIYLKANGPGSGNPVSQVVGN
jgi:hypothetical protein